MAECYEETFAEVIATTPELREECFRLRYQVYCRERQFENPASGAAGLERDIYDDRSEHALLLHRATGISVGTVRLVRSVPTMPLGSLPFHLLCNDVRAHDREFLPPHCTAEVSRFAISKERTQLAFRTAVEMGARHRDSATRSMTILGLLRAAMEMAAINGIEYFCAVMEPALVRRLGSLAVEFKPLGGLVDYHGRRQPCYAHIPSMAEKTRMLNPGVWALATDHGRLAPPLATARVPTSLLPQLEGSGPLSAIALRIPEPAAIGN
jgi:N-acyl amino acid synthase of PEP-CTERM/exosortase system